MIGDHLLVKLTVLLLQTIVDSLSLDLKWFIRPIYSKRKRTNGRVVKVSSLEVFRDSFKERDNTKRYQCVPQNRQCKKTLQVATDRKCTSLSDFMQTTETGMIIQGHKIKRETDVSVASTALVAQSEKCIKYSGYRRRRKFVLLLVNVEILKTTNFFNLFLSLQGKWI